MDQKSNMIITKDNLYHLISKQKWDEVESLLANETTHTVSTSLHDDDLILHYACRFNPPLQAIVNISVRFRSSLGAADEHGRFPIHMSLINGCVPDVFRFFLRTHPENAGIQDIHGKTPMHYAGECYEACYRRNESDLDEVHRGTLLVVQLLDQVAPRSILVEDEEKMSPVEYAVLHATNDDLIKTMQRISRKERYRIPEFVVIGK